MSKEKKATSFAKDPLFESLQANFRFGDFYRLRKICKAHLQREGTPPEKIAYLRDFLHMTGFDGIVIMVGIAAVIFTTIISILAAY